MHLGRINTTDRNPFGVGHGSRGVQGPGPAQPRARRAHGAMTPRLAKMGGQALGFATRHNSGQRSNPTLAES